MALFVLKLLVRIFVFGVALTFAVRRSRDVRVEPRSMLPAVAGVFTALNTLLYYLLATALNLGTLWMFFFIVPFVANAIILLITDRILKPFKIESMTALVRTAGIVTVAHFILRLAHF
jgi:uncharacterized membrane protein YvlD (DUF360 family)